MNKININENVIEIINDNNEKIVVDKNNVYTIYKDNTITFMLIYHNKNSGVPLFTSLTSNLEVNGVIYDNINDLEESIKNEIGTTTSFSVDIVDELPTEGKNGVIYLIAKGDGTYVEWLWIESDGKFETIGDTDINLTNYYTKTEVDTKIDEAITGGEVDLSNYYDKAEVDTELNQKVDNDRVLTDVPANAKFTDTVYDDTTIKADIVKKADKVDTYTKTEVDGLIPDISDLATKTELNQKVDNDRVLTDVPANAKFTDTVYDDTLIKADIEKKADKVDTYTKGEVDGLIPDISDLATKTELNQKVDNDRVLTDVPANAKFTDTVYDDTAIKADIEKKADKVDTYTKGEVDGLIDGIEVDLSNYYNKTEVDTKIDEAITGGEVDLSNYYDKSTTDSKLLLKADKSELENKQDKLTAGTNITISGTTISATDTVYDDTTIKADIVKKADKVDTYTKTEVDSLIPDISDLATKTELNQKVDNDRVLTDVPANAKFTDTVYDDTAIKADIVKKADKVDTYTKGEVDSLIPDISDLATKTELNQKVDNDRVLTDVPANAKFTDTVYDDTLIKADIANKQDKLSAVTDIVMVDELPTTPNPNIMYLIEIE